AFSLGSDVISTHNLEFSALMDLALGALRPTQFMVELKDLGSMPRVLLELVRAEVVNIRVITVIDPQELELETYDPSWLESFESATDVFWCEGASPKAVQKLTTPLLEKLVTSDKDFPWFPILKGWKNPARMNLRSCNPPASMRTMEFSAWGWFSLQDLTELLSRESSHYDQVKGVVFCKTKEAPGDPECYTLIGKKGDLHFSLISHDEHQKCIMGEDDFLNILEDLPPAEATDHISTDGLSSLTFRCTANDPMENEFALARTLEAIWNFHIPWGDCRLVNPQEMEEILKQNLEDLDLEEGFLGSYCGLGLETPAERLPFHDKLGMILRETEDLYIALTHSRFSTALEETPQRLEEMARCCNNLDNYHHAVRLLEKALSLDAENMSVLLNMLRLHLVYGEAERGVQKLDRAFAMAPQDWETILLASHLYFETNRYDDLRELYNNHRAACDTSEDFLLTLASAHLDHGNALEALPILKSLLEKDPENFGILYLMGYADLIDGNMKKAVERLEEAMERGNDISWVYLALGLAYEYLGQKSKAHELFQEAAQVAALEFEDDPSYQPFIESAILTAIASGQMERAQNLLEVNGRNMVFSHEFNNFVKLLSCFSLPQGLSVD
ncbi:tetratricopeptide repeat protein, partial [Myxococcota bacterium]|nr:tetratricopeptide repeat protein [Myxococcota bacterium]